MLRKSKKAVCAWISLMLEKHRKNYPFEIKDIFFTRAEIHRRIEEIFREEISDYIVKQITIGGPVTSRDVFFLTGKDNAFKLYHWLCCPDEYTGYDVDEVVEALEGSYWHNRTAYTSRTSIKEALEKYYSFVRDMRIPVQEEENSEIISREAVWMAVATLTYNDYIRTGSHDAASYNYPSNVVGLVAHSFNTRNSTSTCSTMAWNSCTVGVGEQPWSYLVDTGGVRRDSRRRLSYYGEFEYTQPDLHEDFKINTVTGKMVMALTAVPNVRWWHRNISRHGFCINGFIRHYPDFIVKTQSGKIILIETKGDHLENTETRYKVELGRLWQSMAGSTYRYYMVFQSKELNINGAVQFDAFCKLLKNL